MREQVCIVLNEREQSKAHAAEAVSRVLAERNITASRIPVNETLVTALKKRAPAVLVIDYLLGDLTTGLDVVAELRKHNPLAPHVIMYTDEPSMRVAVDAMKLGARDYIALEGASSLSAVVRGVEDALASTQEEPLPRAHALLKFDDLVSHAPSTRTAVDHARRIAREGPPVTVIVGERGSGVTTFARAIALARAAEGDWSCIDLRNEIRSLASLIHPGDGSLRPLLAPSRSLIILSSELDNDELSPLVERARRSLWGAKPARPTQEFLILGTHDPRVALRWSKSADAAVLELPPLEKRTDDIPGLIHAWIREYELLTGEKRKGPSPEALHALGKLEWPGGLRQLRGGVFHALSSDPKGLINFEESVKEHRASLVEFEESVRASPPSPAAVAWALQRAHGSPRIASVFLGSTPVEIERIAASSEVRR